MLDLILFFGGGFCLILAVERLCQVRLPVRETDLYFISLFAGIGVWKLFHGLLYLKQISSLPLFVYVAGYSAGPSFWLLLDARNEKVKERKDDPDERRFSYSKLRHFFPACLLFASGLYPLESISVLRAACISVHLSCILYGAASWVTEYRCGDGRASRLLPHLGFLLGGLGNIGGFALYGDAGIRGGLFVTALCIFLGWMLHIRKPDTFLSVGAPSQPERRSPAQRRSYDYLGESECEKLLEKLERLMVEERLYLDEELSRALLAAELSIKERQLTYLLNHKLKKSFHQFLNEYRVREAQQMLREEIDRNILSIAMAVGFNSKSTFNLAFLKLTGMTPSSYRREFQKKA